MPLFNHYLHVYQKPKQGTTFIQRYLAYNYQHSILSMGGFDTANCDIAVHSDVEGQQILNQYLGNYVAFYVDNPAQPIWEGLINRITFNSGGASYTVSLDELANRVSVVYTGAVNAAAETTAVNDTVSQSIYGIKQEQIEFGVDTSAANQRTQLQATILVQRAYPQTALTQSQGNASVVHLECIGIYHTLEWVKFFTGLTTATSTFSANVAAVLSVNPNGATFFDNADTSGISTNTNTVPNQERGSSYWDRLQKIAEAGDGTNYWICGVSPTNFVKRTRAFYYKQANTAVEYTAFKSEGLIIRNLYGKKVRPWMVQPDRTIRVEDALVGFSGLQLNDPTLTYIQNIQYDANSQRVEWFGADNTTVRATFYADRLFKPLATDFGAPTRTIAT